MTVTGPVLVTDRVGLARERAALPGRVGVVMTLGALHDGHAALLRAAREQSDHVLVTIFVNPLQFGPSEDFDRYPRTLEADLAMCAEAGVDVVFAPDKATVYPGGEPAVRVDPGPLGAILEGASRPGFFHGVLTVVCKLLRLTRADVTFFGEKDFQQLTLVRQLVRDLELGTEVVAVPTGREPDGLARSSRNQYLSTVERTAALALSRSLTAGATAAAAGASPDATLAAARRVLDDAARHQPAVELDYLVLTDPDFTPATVGAARLLVAARVGATRLIDNTAVTLSGGGAPAAGTPEDSQ